MNFLKQLSLKRYYENKDEVAARNVIASSTFLMVGTLVAFVNLISNLFIRKTNGYFQSILLLVYFIIMIILRKILIKINKRNSTLFMYIVQIPVMIFGILMGTLWDPESETITFFLLLVCMPLFILDNPVRHLIYILSMMGIYIICGFLFKEHDVFLLDLVHALSFLMGSMFSSLFVLAERFDNIENYTRSEYRAQHDVLTGLKSRYALKLDVQKYVGSNVYAALIDVDYFQLFNDLYGHTIGEEIVINLAHKTQDIFGKDIVYRFESDEILILNNTDGEVHFRDKLSALMKEFSQVTIRDRVLHPTCTIAYVYGTPGSRDAMSDLVRHTAVRMLEARNEGRGIIRGYPYDATAKRQTDILAEVSMETGASLTGMDELTGLTNMQFFRIRVDELLGNIIDISEKPVIIYFNIGNFKGYNEINGFLKGDKLLQDIADILREEFSNRIISRFAEDHFVILDYKNEVEDKLNSVIVRVKPLFGNVQMNLKAGINEYTRGEDIGLSCDKAKLACDSIKHDYNKEYVFYDESMELKNKLEQYVISHVDEAAQKGYLKVYYQPIIDVNTGKIMELEALARWVDPIHGFLSPGDFIPVLESARLIHKIDRFIAEQVCKDQEILRQKAGHDVPVSINLSRLDFMLTDIVGEVKSLVERYRVPTKNIHIEVTESALEDDTQELLGRLREFRNSGFEIWLDDFGSGYSSLNSLQDFKFDVIKIDMKFMRTLESKDETSIIVSSIADMVRCLGLKSLTEGVETEYQYEFIRVAHINMAQGFLFSRPVTIDELDLSDK
ncbi:MAG: EAL domain-containing protein [Eubacterium sp.]|nr:EAL domain-containing protein [Eubacterium sp.]